MGSINVCLKRGERRLWDEAGAGYQSNVGKGYKYGESGAVSSWWTVVT